MKILRRLLYVVAYAIIIPFILAEIVVRLMLTPIVWIITGRIGLPENDNEVWANHICFYIDKLLPEEDK